MAEILIYDIIGESFFFEGITAKSVKSQLDEIDEGEDILVRINSPGGDAFEGLAIHNLLAERGVDVRIDGLAASSASIVAAAGDTVRIADNALIMIHNPWSFAIGEARDMRKRAESLDKVKDSAIVSYQRKSDESADSLASMMDDETWMNAADAVEFGFADETTGEDAAMDEDEVKSMLNQSWIHHRPSVAMVGNCVKFRLSHRPKPAQGVRQMADKQITVEFIAENHPEIADALRAESAEDARAEGATVERERIQAVLAQSLPGHEDLVNQLAFDGETTGEQAAVKVLQAEKAMNTTRLESRRNDAPDPVAHSNAPDPGPDAADDRPVKEIAEDEWQNSASLRAEFGDDKESYIAFRVNEGSVKFLRDRSAA